MERKRWLKTICWRLPPVSAFHMSGGYRHTPKGSINSWRLEKTSTRNKLIATVTRYNLNDHHLEVVNSNKYLGVAISEDLTWVKHIQDVAGKTNKTPGFLRRNLRDCNTLVKVATYTTMVKLVIEYASNCEERTQSERGTHRYASNNWLHVLVLFSILILHVADVASWTGGAYISSASMSLWKFSCLT